MRAIVVALALLGSPAALADTIVVAPAPCAPLAGYTPSDDVAFQPGVDVHGRSVARADLPETDGSGITAESVGVAIEVPIITSQGGDAGALSPRDFDATVEVGTVTVDADGTARLDGVPLASQQIFPGECGVEP